MAFSSARPDLSKLPLVGLSGRQASQRGAAMRLAGAGFADSGFRVSAVDALDVLNALRVLTGATGPTGPTGGTAPTAPFRLPVQSAQDVLPLDVCGRSPWALRRRSWE